jgi:hypothetical protein
MNYHLHNSSRKNSKGFSLVSILVAVGILGIIATISSSWFTNMDKISSKLDDLQGREEIRQYLRIQLDCEKTIEKFPPECKLNKIPKKAKRRRLVKVFSRSNGKVPLIPANKSGHEIGSKYRVRSYCQNIQPGKILFEVSHRGQNWKALYEKALIPDCSGQIF